MANLSALNYRFIKLQKLLLPLSAHNLSLATANSSISNLNLRAASIVLLQSYRTHTNSSCIVARPLTTATTAAAYETCRLKGTIGKCYSSSSDKQPVTNSAAFTGTIDEFRLREEQREKDFTQQQQTEEAQQNSEAEEQAKRAKVDAIRLKILAAALPHVPTLGWSRNAIAQGAEDVGLPSVVHGMFPEGGFELVSYFYGQCNEELIKTLQTETQNGQKEIGNPLDFLVNAVRRRLEMIAPYKGQWPQALALMALPQNASTALAQVLTLVDDICYYSGDRSVDFGWYTRRIGLATIMKMTELYMLQDNTPGHEKTWEFLKKRMDDAVQLQMLLGQTEDMKSNFQRSFNSAFVTARNILGLGYTRR